jgi:hypothetical protein
MKPTPSTETRLFGPSSTIAGMGVTAAKKGVQSVVNALLRSDPTSHYGEVARALSEQGAARDARLMSVVNALNSRQGNAAAAPTVGNTSAVVAASRAIPSRHRARAFPAVPRPQGMRHRRRFAPKFRAWRTNSRPVSQDTRPLPNVTRRLPNPWIGGQG